MKVLIFSNVKTSHTLNLKVTQLWLQ
jgi:hypothetical protein